MYPQQSFAIEDASQVAEARRKIAELSRAAGFSETSAGQVSIAVTEAAGNIVKHASAGELLVSGLAGQGLEIIAIDRGPGLSSAAAMRDGYSTAGSPGTGLGAMRRLASEFGLFSTPGNGCALRLAFGPNGIVQPANGFEIGAVCLPKPGEVACGDAWAVRSSADRFTVLLADGLGHGPEAAIAAQAAIAVLSQPDQARAAPADLIAAVHGELRATRGAAVGVAEVAFTQGTARFAGVGNIAASVRTGETNRQLVSHNGIVGGNVRKIQEFEAAWHADALLIMHSDGLGTHWDLASYPGLVAQHPALIAAVLYRDFSRKRDDVTVVVAKYHS